MSTIQFHTLTIKNIIKETKDCVSVWFDIPQELQNDFSFKQGQYLTLKTKINGEDLRRSYSLCSSPSSNQFAVAIKKILNGKFSTYINENLKIGDKIEVMTPAGKFFTELNSANTKNYLAFAVGSGITPIISIIKETLLVEPNSKFTLVYGNRTKEQTIFFDEINNLEKLNSNFKVIYTFSNEPNSEIEGRISKEKCEELHSKNLINLSSMNEIFLCGPETMILNLKDYFTSINIDEKKVHFELFNTNISTKETPKKELNGDKSHVTIWIDGESYEYELDKNGDTILDSALETGADLPFACKGGVCCTCKAKVIKGSATMDVNYSLDASEIAAGYILSCQAHPTTDEIEVDFDVI